MITPNKGEIRLALGTAQLGMPYGVANRTGKPDKKLAGEIVDTAWRYGIRYYDTAQAYGDSEEILGENFQLLGITDQVKVISKIDPASSPLDEVKIRASLQTSLNKLNVNHFWALLIHNPEWLEFWEKRLGPILTSLQEDGLFRYLGASVYTIEQAEQALNIERIQCLQLPFNVLDRRHLESGIIAKAKKLEKKVFLRSVYLQGLLLLPVRKVPEYCSDASSGLKYYRKFCLNNGIDPKELALAYALNRVKGATVVVGAETTEQVKENCRMAKRGSRYRKYFIALERYLKEQGIEPVDPRSWGGKEQGWKGK